MTVIIRDAASGKWRVYDCPVDVVVASRVEEVIPALKKIERACLEQRKHAAGFLSYEAAPAFDAALETKRSDGFPLLCFGVFNAPRHRTLDELGTASAVTSEEPWEPSLSQEGYDRGFARLQGLIRNGDTYQVNYTYRIRTQLKSIRSSFSCSSPRRSNPRSGHLSIRQIGRSAVPRPSCSSIAPLAVSSPVR